MRDELYNQMAHINSSSGHEDSRIMIAKGIDSLWIDLNASNTLGGVRVGFKQFVKRSLTLNYDAFKINTNSCIPLCSADKVHSFIFFD